jgi:hypothetical protein
VSVPRVFLSHASEDKADFAEPFGRELASLGVRPWLDKWEIRPGDSLVTKLFDEGVAAVDAVIVSRHSAGKRWVRAELDAAMVRKITEDTRLIPIRLDEADIPAPLKTLVWHNAARTETGYETPPGSSPIRSTSVTPAQWWRRRRRASGQPRTGRKARHRILRRTRTAPLCQAPAPVRWRRHPGSGPCTAGVPQGHRHHRSGR